MPDQYSPAAFDAFSTWADLGNPDADPQEEIRRLWERQRAIDGLLSGTIPIDYVEDMLAEHDIDPYEWAEVGEQNLIVNLSQCPG